MDELFNERIQLAERLTNLNVFLLNNESDVFTELLLKQQSIMQEYLNVLNERIKELKNVRHDRLFN
tara:strand:+ start:166 stop:363 length:198 start_codon:yes stop_codon:yes gene_type:complete